MTEQDERRRILRMVAEGQLEPEEAADLLEAVQPEPELDAETNHGAIPPIPPVPPVQPVEAQPRRRSRRVVIQIREGGENRVNLAIPVTLTKAAGKFLPRQAQQYLGKYDINLQEFLEDISDSETGAVLEVRDGENKVLIAVE